MSKAEQQAKQTRPKVGIEDIVRLAQGCLKQLATAVHGEMDTSQTILVGVQHVIVRITQRKVIGDRRRLLPVDVASEL